MPTDQTKSNPATQYVRCPNRLSVVAHSMPHVGSSAVGVWVRAGGRYEPAAHSGVSHFIEHLLFKGTRTRRCDQLKQAIEGVGGSLNGFTAEEFTCYMAKVPAAYLARAVTILADMVRHPAFRPADVERERDVILEEIRMYEDTPGQYVHDVLNQLLWPHHPLGNLLSGTQETVRRMTRTQILRYWTQFYHPRNLLVSCAGAQEPETVIRMAKRAFAGTRAGRLTTMRRAPTVPRGLHIRVVQKKTEQTHLCLGTPAIPRTHPQRFALELLHVLLGANMSSRLFHEVREKRGLVYEIGTHIKRFRDTGAFVIYAGCDTAKVSMTLRTVMAELGRIKREPVSARELSRAKEFYRGQLVMALEETTEQMLWLGEQAMTIGRISAPEEVIKAIDRVTIRQIQQAAQALFTPARLCLAVVGPMAEQDASLLRGACQETN